MSTLDFTANAKEGIAIDWPVRYADIAPWYDYVETYIGVTGQTEGLPQLPDGKFSLPWNSAALEEVKSSDGQVSVVFTISRIAHHYPINSHTTEPAARTCQYRQPLQPWMLPAHAQQRQLSSALPATAATGNMTLRPIRSSAKSSTTTASGKATGVKVQDAETGEQLEFFGEGDIPL